MHAARSREKGVAVGNIGAAGHARQLILMGGRYSGDRRRGWASLPRLLTLASQAGGRHRAA